MNTICAREWLRPEDTANIDTFSVDTIEGLTVNLPQGQLSRVKSPGKAKKLEVLGLFHGEVPDGRGMGGVCLKMSAMETVRWRLLRRLNLMARQLTL